jgi:hypothetical protein
VDRQQVGRAGVTRVVVSAGFTRPTVLIASKLAPTL